ncbi:MAG: hypothetical protein IJ485_06030 [Lachnospiraceae bacterium]|nr:hypothetical protein [Lachnospiraceae bacterium]
MRNRKSYIYTNKTHSQKSLMSTVFGILGLVTIILALHFTFLAKGVASARYGIAGLLSCIFALTGMILGVMARMEEDKYYLFAYIGMTCNFLVLAGDVALLLLGIL